MLLVYLSFVLNVTIFSLESNKIGTNVQVKSRKNGKKTFGIINQKHVGVLSRINKEENVTIHQIDDGNIQGSIYTIFIDNYMICKKPKNFVDMCTSEPNESSYWEIYYVQNKGYMFLMRQKENLCLAYDEKDGETLLLEKCSSTRTQQFWDIGVVGRDFSYEPSKDDNKKLDEPLSKGIVRSLYGRLKNAINNMII